MPDVLELSITHVGVQMYEIAGEPNLVFPLILEGRIMTTF